MPVIEPFAALRPRPDWAAQICAPPYDVLSSTEARAQAAGNPWSFLHVSKPEIDLPPRTDPYAPAVYARGAENFARMIAAGALRRDPQPALYLYRQVLGAHAQVGVVALARCEDYRRGLIKRHELTHPDKEDDRLRHIRTLKAQTGPAFVVYRAGPALEAFLARQTQRAPDVDFTAPDGVRHSSWPITDAGERDWLAAEFAQLPAFYIADGHHRTAAAVRLCEERNAAGGSAGFLAVIFPHTQVQILPYHRLVRDLGGLTPEAFLRQLATVCEVRPGGGAPTRAHELALFLAGHWYTLAFRSELTRAADPVEQLDVTLLQRHVLEPLLGIADPRMDARLDFVGGVRGLKELERRVQTGAYACAFALFPASIEDLMRIADAGGILPPKSTWFEPKLRDGMFCHVLD